MPEQQDAGREILGTGRGRTLLQKAGHKTSLAIEHLSKLHYIPPYQVTNTHWELTFRALGWDRKTVETFWAVFCRINKSLDGEITRDEFLDYFDLAQTLYVDKCFSYFDTTGGGTIDFLEFMVSVWNMCTMKVDTLTNFAFDLFNLDSDGELSFPEIESMIEELYGEDGVKRGIGKEAMDDITLFTEERGGRLRLADFTIYTASHQLLLFPIFQIQRKIQTKVLGERYWRKVERKRRSNSIPVGEVNISKTGNEFDPRHVQTLLRTYKTGAAAAVLTHTGDANQGLREWFEKQNSDLPFIQQTDAEQSAKNTSNNQSHAAGWERVRNTMIRRKGGSVVKKSAGKLRERLRSQVSKHRDIAK